jgi:hypothetical protein
VSGVVVERHGGYWERVTRVSSFFFVPLSWVHAGHLLLLREGRPPSPGPMFSPCKSQRPDQNLDHLAPRLADS